MTACVDWREMSVSCRSSIKIGLESGNALKGRGIQEHVQILCQKILITKQCSLFQVYHLQQELQWHVNNGCQVSDRANKAAELLTDFPLNIVPKDNMSMSIKENMSMSTKDNISTKDSMSTSITPVSEQTASPDSTTVSPVDTGCI